MHNQWILFKNKINWVGSYKQKLLLYLVTIFFAILAILGSLSHKIPIYVMLPIYILAFCLLIPTTGLFFYTVRNYWNQLIRWIVSKNLYIEALYLDYDRRSFLFSIPSFLLNIAYALFNGIIGIQNRSVWYISLSVYYFLLSCMRFQLLQYGFFAKKSNISKTSSSAWKTLFCCGMLLLAMSVALVGVVILMVRYGYGKTYSRDIIELIALYTFYKVISSITNVVKARKMKSPLLISMKNISHADALVSLLSLQTAMFAVFAEPSSTLPVKMNAITGAFVCIWVIGISVWMMCLAKKSIEKIKKRAG